MAKVLLGLSNALFKDGDYVPSGFMEQISDALKDAGNEVLLYIPNKFQGNMFGGNNELFENLDTDKLEEDIKNFNPDLVITFNNTIYNNIINIVNCPIAIWGADTEPFWNSKELIKENSNRYLFFCFSEKEIKPRQEYFGIKDDKIFLMPPATNLKNLHLEKDKNISFIGTCFYIHPDFTNFLDKYRGTDNVHQLITNFKNYFIENGNLLKNINNEEFISDFNLIDKSAYTRFFSGEKRLQTLLNVSDLGLHVWGEGDWEKTRDLLPTFYSCVHKDKITTASENEWCYNTSKICLNINHDQSVNGMNFRVCDVLVSGGCLISSYSPFIKEQFKELNIPMFNDSFEARELCKKYLLDEKLREDYVLKSNEVIKNGWTFKDRFNKIEEITGVKLNNQETGKGSADTLQPIFKTCNKETKKFSKKIMDFFKRGEK